MKVISKQYNEEIEQNAKTYGYKTANLMHLKGLVEEFAQTDICKQIAELYAKKQTSDQKIVAPTISVPQFEGVSSELIIEHLDKYTPEWKDQYNAFVDKFNAQQEKTNIGAEAKKELTNLQETIKNCFKEQPIEIPTTPVAESLMIRSTGIHEDKKDMANPGGNASLPSLNNPKAISEAIGEVAASYVGEKSLTQRLLSGDKHITEFPVMPVLIQQMIRNENTSSGVVYSNNGATRMQAAPGHGEYVVNSKGPTDDYYVSKNNIVFQAIAVKNSKMVVDEQYKMKSEPNKRKAKYDAALDENATIFLHEFSKFLEEKYGNRVDIEFVYDKTNSAISIVQVRAIPENEHKLSAPSSITNKYLNDNKGNILINKAIDVITPEVNNIVVVNKQEEVIISTNIADAQSEYFRLQKQSDEITKNIKAILVEAHAPNTSHEAGFFNSQSISVMQVKDIQAIKQLFSKEGSVILDPQRGSFYKLNETVTKDDLFEKGHAEEGIFASSLSDKVTITQYEHDFSKLTASELSQRLVDTKDIFEEMSLGSLIAKSKNGDAQSADKLFSFMANAMKNEGKVSTEAQEPTIINSAAALSESYFKALAERPQSIISNKHGTQTVINSLDTLSKVSFGNDNQEAKNALSSLLKHTMQLSTDKKISPDLFKSIMISGAEIYAQLNDMPQKHFTSEEKQQEQTALIQYLDVQKKFSGLFNGAGNSAANEKKEGKYAEIIETAREIGKSSGIHLTKVKEAYLTNFLKLGKYFVSKETEEKWNKFCVNICLKTKNAQLLGTIIEEVVSHNIQSKWLNYIFSRITKAEQATKTLAKLAKDFEGVDFSEIGTAKQIIDAMTASVGNWSDPAKFEKLYNELENNLTQLNESLQWNKNEGDLAKILKLEQANKLIEILDHTIKSLSRSAEYKEMTTTNGSNLQASNSLKLIAKFNEVMKIWVNNSITEVGPKNHGYTGHTEALKEIDKFINEKSSIKLEKTELSPSPYFAVNTCTLVTNGRALDLKTLEDIFTLVHQNSIIAVATTNKGFSSSIETQYPEQLRLVNNYLEGAIKGETWQKITPSSFIQLNKDSLHIIKNYPLRDHSCTAEINYDLNKETTSVKFSIFGTNDSNRWGHIAIDCYLIGRLEGLEFAVQPKFDPLTNIMSFEVEVRDSQIDVAAISDIINLSIGDSFKIVHTKSYLDGLYSSRESTTNKLSKKFPKEAEKFREVTAITLNVIPSGVVMLSKIGIPLGEFALYINYPKIWEKITSFEAIELYKFGAKPEDLIKYVNYPETWEEITSVKVINCCKAGAQFKELIKYIDKPAIWEKITSFEAQECYKVGVKFEDLIKYVNNHKLWKKITSFDARECYKVGVKFEDLIKYVNNHKLWDMITSFDARECYKLDIKLEDIIKYADTYTRLKKLISSDAQYCYKLGLKPQNLENFLDNLALISKALKILNKFEIKATEILTETDKSISFSLLKEQLDKLKDDKEEGDSVKSLSCKITELLPPLHSHPEGELHNEVHEAHQVKVGGEVQHL